MNHKPIQSQSDYLNFLDNIKSEIQRTRIQISRVANRELIGLYWKLGKAITEKQKHLGWGKSVVEQLAKDLQKTFEGRKGFSTQNLWYMRQFYMTYEKNEILQQLVGEVPWGQNLVIMSKAKDEDERKYYINSTIQMGWSRKVLVHQIESNAYQRHKLIDKQNNFNQTLPAHLAEQANLSMKDSYMLDMLGLGKPLLEAKLETLMVSNIKEVMMELGYGFAFIGNQYRIIADNKEYFIDLLFSNRKLNALVAIELKIGKFKPEYAGKMNFYLNLLDDYVKEPNENPSIGIILCKSKDKFEVEYALRGLNKPIGISKYQLTKELPKEFKDKLPDAKKLEKEILQELNNLN